MDQLEWIIKLHDFIHPKHVATSASYFNEMDGLFHGRWSVNRKPTGENVPVIGHATSAVSAINALELAALDAYQKMLEKEGD